MTSSARKALPISLDNFDDIRRNDYCYVDKTCLIQRLLDNMKVDTILSDKYADCFGFTQAEINQLAQDYAVPDKIEEIKEWYDGYRFGNQDIYNPWSVLKYLKAGCEPQAYWLDTASNDLVIEALHRLSQTEQSDEAISLSLCLGRGIFFMLTCMRRRIL